MIARWPTKTAGANSGAMVRMCDALALVQLTVAGEPLTSVTARKVEGYVKSMRSSE